MQLWHLNIIQYFHSGAVGISFDLMIQRGAAQLLTTIVTLAIDVSIRRFDKLRNLYSMRQEETNQLLEHGKREVEQAIEGGLTQGAIQYTMILALCSLLLYLRGIPYGRTQDLSLIHI